MKNEAQIFKNKLRARFLEVRNSISNTAVMEKSSSIIKKLTELSLYDSAAVIHSYVSITEKNEVQTHDFLKKSIMLNKKVLVPKMLSGGILAHSSISSLEELRVNKWGIPEPVTENQQPPTDINLVIVPMVAGDRQKNRLGYGKGYYDRFLNGLSAYKIGLLFNCQLYDNGLPTEDFDVPLDMLITEYETIG